MVKQNKKKKQLRNEAEWQDIRIRRNSVKSLKQMLLNLDVRTYDDVIQYLLTKESSQ
jgi:hypothetical protein